MKKLISHNNVIYVPKKIRKVEVLDKRLFYKKESFSKLIMVSAATSKDGKTPIFFVEPNAKENAKYYSNALSKKIIPEINRLAKHNEYLFMQEGARTHTAKLT